MSEQKQGDESPPPQYSQYQRSNYSSNRGNGRPPYYNRYASSAYGRGRGGYTTYPRSPYRPPEPYHPDPSDDPHESHGPSPSESSVRSWKPKNSIKNLGYNHPPKVYWNSSDPTQRPFAPPPVQAYAIPGEMHILPPTPVAESVGPSPVGEPAPSPLPIDPSSSPAPILPSGVRVLARSASQSASNSTRRVNNARRDWNITLWNDHIDGALARASGPLAQEIQYMICQLEAAPSTGRLHWQIYLELKEPRPPSWIKADLFANNTVHCEFRLGPRDNAREYCRKATTAVPGDPAKVGPFEIGTWLNDEEKTIAVGRKRSLRDVTCAIREGQDMASISADFPEIMIHNRHNLIAYRDEFLSRQARQTPRAVTVRLFVGPTNSGKTHLATQEATYYTKGDMSKVYILDSGGKRDSLWFDGYDYGPVVIIDDYDSWIQVSYLLRLLDKFPVNLPVKGSMKQACYTEVWITSNKPLQAWTDNNGSPIAEEHRAAIYRRLDWYLVIPSRGIYQVIKKPHEPIIPHLPTVEPIYDERGPTEEPSHLSFNESSFVRSVLPTETVREYIPTSVSFDRASSLGNPAAVPVTAATPTVEDNEVSGILQPTTTA